MVVQHNLQAMNANRMLGITTKTVAGSTEKLSSGYKINRAADDAAGLSISEKMRKQIRGLSQASANAEDGISCVQTAEGALAEVTDMLQRMNELVIQAANGTNSTTDRGYIQNEINQLVTEIDRVAETTKFNETYLLKGDDAAETKKVYTANYAVTYSKNTGTNSAAVNHKVNYTGNANIYFVNSSSVTSSNASKPVTADVIGTGDDVTKYMKTTTKGQNGRLTDATLDTTYKVLKNADASQLKVGTAAAANDTLQLADGRLTAASDAYIFDTITNTVVKIAQGEDLSDYMNLTDDKKAVSMKDRYRLLDEVDYVTTDGKTKANTSLGGKVPANDINLTSEFKLAESRKVLYDADGNVVSGMALHKYFDENGEYKGGLFDSAQATTEVRNNDGTANVPQIADYITKSTAEVTADLEFSLHVGADSARTNKIYATIQSMSAASLGVNSLKSTSVGIVDETGDNATDSIDIISAALQKVSTQRSSLGAIQNRLEHTIKNLDNIVENTQSAESAIRDTDMATEMVKYSNANVLAQAGQSMLAQANQSNQGVLSLLG